MATARTPLATDARGDGCIGLSLHRLLNQTSLVRQWIEHDPRSGPSATAWTTTLTTWKLVVTGQYMYPEDITLLAARQWVQWQ